MYHIYRIPDYKHKNGLIGKIGVSEIPSERVEKQGYSNFEILESHTDIIKVSERERELQKQYGYPVDSVPYYISRKFWGSVAGKVGGQKCKEQKIGFHSSREHSIKGGHVSIKKRKENNGWSSQEKQVIQLDKTGKLIATYKSVSEASTLNNFNKSGIANVCRGLRPFYQKFVWKYKD
jgi:hypothetical protein